MRLNLDWNGSSRPGRIPPRHRLSTTESPRPVETGISSFGRSGNQKLGSPSLSGVRKRTGRGPRLSRVLVTDLRDPARLVLLHREASRERLVGSSESERLKVFAAAAHALAYGRSNPAGLFAAIVRRGLWQHLTLRDEDAGRMAMRSLTVEQRLPVSARHTRPVPAPESRADIRRLIARSLGLLTEGCGSTSL